MAIQNIFPIWYLTRAWTVSYYTIDSNTNDLLSLTTQRTSTSLGMTIERYKDLSKAYVLETQVESNYFIAGVGNLSISPSQATAYESSVDAVIFSSTYPLLLSTFYNIAIEESTSLLISPKQSLNVDIDMEVDSGSEMVMNLIQRPKMIVERLGEPTDKAAFAQNMWISTTVLANVSIEETKIVGFSSSQEFSCEVGLTLIGQASHSSFQQLITTVSYNRVNQQAGFYTRADQRTSLAASLTKNQGSFIFPSSFQRLIVTVEHNLLVEVLSGIELSAKQVNKLSASLHLPPTKRFSFNLGTTSFVTPNTEVIGGLWLAISQNTDASIDMSSIGATRVATPVDMTPQVSVETLYSRNSWVPGMRVENNTSSSIHLDTTKSYLHYANTNSSFFNSTVYNTGLVTTSYGLIPQLSCDTYFDGKHRIVARVFAISQDNPDIRPIKIVMETGGVLSEESNFFITGSQGAWSPYIVSRTLDLAAYQSIRFYIQTDDQGPSISNVEIYAPSIQVLDSIYFGERLSVESTVEANTDILFSFSSLLTNVTETAIDLSDTGGKIQMESSQLSNFLVEEKDIFFQIEMGPVVEIIVSKQSTLHPNLQADQYNSVDISMSFIDAPMTIDATQETEASLSLEAYVLIAKAFIQNTSVFADLKDTTAGQIALQLTLKLNPRVELDLFTSDDFKIEPRQETRQIAFVNLAKTLSLEVEQETASGAEYMAVAVEMEIEQENEAFSELFENEKDVRINLSQVTSPELNLVSDGASFEVDITETLISSFTLRFDSRLSLESSQNTGTYIDLDNTNIPVEGYGAQILVVSLGMASMLEVEQSSEQNSDTDLFLSTVVPISSSTSQETGSDIGTILDGFGIELNQKNSMSLSMSYSVVSLRSESAQETAISSVLGNFKYMEDLVMDQVSGFIFDLETALGHTILTQYQDVSCDLLDATAMEIEGLQIVNSYADIVVTVFSEIEMECGQSSASDIGLEQLSYLSEESSQLSHIYFALLLDSDVAIEMEAEQHTSSDVDLKKTALRMVDKPDVTNYDQCELK